MCVLVISILPRQRTPVCVFVIQTGNRSCLIKLWQLFIRSTKKSLFLLFLKSADCAARAGSAVWVTQPSGGNSARVRNTGSRVSM